MAESAQRVPEDSPTYREFSRLYDLARQLRPTGVDRWNRELYATSGPGGLDQRTGAIGIHEPLLRAGLTRNPTDNPRRQGRALATVLNRVTQAGMEVDAPGEVNAVGTTQSQGLHEGVAAVRAANDFDVFTRSAGYPHLAFDGTQQSGAYVAANDLIQQASGPSVDRLKLINRLNNGPAVMHFDQLAEAVVRNRLQEVAPSEGADRQAVRRELITTMLHPQWDSLAQRSPEAGQHVAGEIGKALNAKVDEIRQRFQHTVQEPAADGVRQQAVEPTPVRDSKQSEVPAARFLSGVAPAAGALGQRPSLGDGSRAAVERGTATVRSRGPGESPRRWGD
ncbi:hypothetical protein EV649_6762 [Kribbella sp. VKM Ac-2569]|uniref:hypothetical protein n=1 Tax=Kribbella sp. VKM Ac-2569 TaxID=2512220 RepID=UPI00102B3636|nr:hypothetical protein [Kribbella sp. VKM Ac-2569]RZT13566.1 hypothetical protein EV649_6762 [Kribbella sp. VKM Ac-2569]